MRVLRGPPVGASTCGWSSFTDCSRAKRSRSAESRWRSTLAAHSCWSRPSQARHTEPLPPRAMGSMRVYRPAMVSATKSGPA
ncbi:hypothetical protein CIK52_10080 [Kocuria rosea]|nr:hypothetical protein CIK52_10080 [Kocuria rosea]